MSVALSVDLEPNKDGSFDGVAEAMRWFDETVPRGTAFVTYRVATEHPEIVKKLAVEHEIGVHVHPSEFGHDHDQLAALDPERQYDIIKKTRSSLQEILSQPVTSFRAGRHSLSLETISVLADLGFNIDASVHVRYDEYLPDGLSDAQDPFRIEDGIVEIPTSYASPSLFSLPGLRVFPQRTVTATANTLRTDARFCSGPRALRTVFEATDVASMYMHPYDASDYHDDLENAGQTFRDRVEQLLSSVEEFLTIGDVAMKYAGDG